MSDNIARLLALAAIGSEGGGGGGALTPIVVNELPSVGEEGVLYLVPRQVTETRNVFDEYIYVGSNWEKIGSTDIDFTNYYTKSEVDGIVAQKYTKPNTGVPLADLNEAVQTSLGKADSALQTEIDPVFLSSAAANITTGDINNWNGKISSESDPIYSASPAAGITSANITNWNNKQDAITTMNIIANYDNNVEKYVIVANDVNRILDKRNSGDKFDLFIELYGDESYNGTFLASFEEYAASGLPFVFINFQTGFGVSSEENDHPLVQYRGELIRDYDCEILHFEVQDVSKLISNINPAVTYTSEYPSAEAVKDFTNSQFLSKTNTTSYTPTGNYHPATKKYVDDKASNYLAKDNTTAFTPTGDYQPATKKYVDDNAGGGSIAPTIIDASSVYSLTDLPTVSQREKEITNTSLINQLESLEDDILNREKGGANLLFKISGTETGTYIYLPMHLMRMNESSDMISFIMGDPLLSRYYTLYGVDTSGHKIWQLSWGADGLENAGDKVSIISNDILNSLIYYPSVRATTQYVDSKVARYTTMPNAFSKSVGDIVQYVGATTQDYTHGYFYECVLISETKTWQRLDVQPSSSYEFFDGSQSEWDALTQEQQKSILFAAVNEFELTSEEEAILLGVLGDKTGIDTDTELEETLNAFLNIAGENE